MSWQQKLTPSPPSSDDEFKSAGVSQHSLPTPSSSSLVSDEHTVASKGDQSPSLSGLEDLFQESVVDCNPPAAVSVSFHSEAAKQEFLRSARVRLLLRRWKRSARATTSSCSPSSAERTVTGLECREAIHHPTTTYNGSCNH